MNTRLSFPKIEGTEILFTNEFQEYLLSLHDLLAERILEARKERIRTIKRVHKNDNFCPFFVHFGQFFRL